MRKGFPRLTDGKWFKLGLTKVDKLIHEATVDYPVFEVIASGDCPFSNNIGIEEKLTFVPPEEWNDWGRLPTYIREEDGRPNLISSARLTNVFTERRIARAVILNVLSNELSNQTMCFLKEINEVNE